MATKMEKESVTQLASVYLKELAMEMDLVTRSLSGYPMELALELAQEQW